MERARIRRKRAYCNRAGPPRSFKMMRVLIFLLWVLPLLAFSVSATDNNEILRRQMERSGTGNLYENLPRQAKDGLDGMGIQNPDPNTITRFTPANLLKSILNSAKQAAQRPVKSIVMVFGILLACALLGTLKNSFGEKPLKNVFDTVCALCIAAAVLTPVSQCMTTCCNTVRQSGSFSLMFLPVFTGLVTASGHPASATIYHGLMLTISQAIIQIASTTFIPMVSIYLAFCVVGSVSPGVNVSGLAKFSKKIVVWGLTLCVTIFVGILTVQGLISNAADSVTVKTAKFVVGSFVPVVGGAISDAVNTVVGCANLLKTATGAYAIIVFVLAFLPAVLECLFWMLAIDVSVAVADILAVPNMSGLLNSIKEAICILLALVLTSALALIVSTSLMLLLGTGG